MLFYLLGIPAALTAIGVFLIWPALSKWWILPILLGAFVVWNLLYVLYVWIICKRVDMSEPCPEIDPFYRRNTLIDRKSTRLNSSHPTTSRMPSSA